MMSYKEIEEEWIKTVNEKKHIISLIDNKEILSVDRFIERNIFMNINMFVLNDDYCNVKKKFQLISTRSVGMIRFFLIRNKKYSI